MPIYNNTKLECMYEKPNKLKMHTIGVPTLEKKSELQYIGSFNQLKTGRLKDLTFCGSLNLWCFKLMNTIVWNKKTCTQSFS